jgi:DNA polymerase elongation subunit (family B)
MNEKENWIEYTMKNNINFDFASLYPTIMRYYDIKPDETVEQKAERIRNERKKKLERIFNG